jgi:flagellar basal-body rod protein FlgC
MEAISAIKDTAQQGMRYEMLRSELSATRIALANVPVTSSGVEKLQRMQNELFQTMLSQDINIDDGVHSLQNSVETRRAYEPKSPYADEQGFVTYANIDLANELIQMTMARRAYEANVKVFNNASRMSSAAMKIGK